MASSGFGQSVGQQRLRCVRQPAQTSCCLQPGLQSRTARMPSSPGSLSRGMRLRVIGMSSAFWDKKMCETAVWAATAGSGSVGYKFFISCTICWVTGTGGAFLAAARARPRSPDRASVATLQTRNCLCWAADCVVPREVVVTSHPARTRDHRAGQSSNQKRSSRASRK